MAETQLVDHCNCRSCGSYQQPFVSVQGTELSARCSVCGYVERFVSEAEVSRSWYVSTGGGQGYV